MTDELKNILAMGSYCCGQPDTYETDEEFEQAIQAIIDRSVAEAETNLAKRLFVAKTEQRVIDCNTYGPTTLEECIEQLQSATLTEQGEK